MLTMKLACCKKYQQWQATGLTLKRLNAKGRRRSRERVHPASD